MKNRVMQYIGLSIAWVACVIAGSAIGGKLGSMVAEDLYKKSIKEE